MASLSDLYTHLKTLCEQWFYNKSEMDTALGNKISKSSTSGLVKNDGSIDTSAYITSNSLPTKTSDLQNDGADGTNVFVANNDSRLSDSRTPTSHTHGNLSNDGKIGSNANYFVYTTTGGIVTSKQKIGDINTSGQIGSTANKPLITTTSGKITTGSFGTSANTFCQGNDSRLSDARTPTAHNQASSTITDTNTYSNIGNSSGTQESINSAINTKLGELVDINFVTVVQTLPTASSSTMGKIYLVAITGSGTNNYAEYVTVKDGSNYSWEKFGEVSGSGLSVDWSDITSKPSTYPPSSHTHNNITNDGKVTVTGTSGGNMVVTNSSNEVIVDTTINVMDALVQQLITYGSS